MKFMKAYKIAVPIVDVIHGEPQTITRQEIHELVKAHAEKLGYKQEFNLRNEKYLFYDSSGVAAWTSDKLTFDSDPAVEISWKIFLKLTLGDVEEIEGWTDEELNKLISEPTTTDRNEKALHESIKLMCDNARDAGYARGLLSGFLLCFNEDSNVRDFEMLKLCIKNADEFLKQADEK